MVSFSIDTVKTRSQCHYKRRGKQVIVGKLISDGAGGGSASNPIPVSVFNNSTNIEEGGHIVKDDNSAIYAVVPTFDGSGLLVKATGGVGTMDLPAGTYAITIRGQ